MKDARLISRRMGSLDNLADSMGARADSKQRLTARFVIPGKAGTKGSLDRDGMKAAQETLMIRHTKTPRATPVGKERMIMSDGNGPKIAKGMVLEVVDKITRMRTRTLIAVQTSKATRLLRDIFPLRIGEL
jgi:hypothetical protein